MPHLPVYVINLDRRPDRLDTISGDLHRLGLSFERVPAVDARLLPPEDKADRNPLMRAGSKACMLSHSEALRRFLASDRRAAMILEDDAELASDLPAVCGPTGWCARRDRADQAGTAEQQQEPPGPPLRANAERTGAAAGRALERRFRRLSHKPGRGRHLPRGVPGRDHVDRPHAVRSPHLESRAARQAGAGQSSDDPATPVGVGHRADQAVDLAPAKKVASAAPPEPSLPDAPPVVAADRPRAPGMGAVQREPRGPGYERRRPGFGSSGFGSPGFGSSGFGSSGFGSSGFGHVMKCHVLSWRPPLPPRTLVPDSGPGGGTVGAGFKPSPATMLQCRPDAKTLSCPSPASGACRSGRAEVPPLASFGRNDGKQGPGSGMS